jgi:signal transduction histidine kinase
MVGMPIRDFVFKDDYQLVYNNIKREHTDPYEHRALHRDGSIRHVEVCGRHVQYHGMPVRVTSVHDITDKKLADEQISKLNDHQKQVSKMEAIGNFASGIAHDFNNAMQPVIGNCDLILHDLKTADHCERCKKNVLSILAAAETATRLVHRIQSFTRKGSKIEQLRTLRLDRCLTETFDFLRSMIPKSIEMELDVAGDLHLVTATDITIRQILMNLCKNAAQAIPENIGKITIRALNDEVFVERYGIRPGKYIRLEVEDNGSGMDREILDKALDPYFTTKRVDEGTGIGLSVVHGIVSSYNGFIRLYSEPENGTTVLVYIPVVEDIGQNIIECKIEDIKLGNGEHILLVDDEEAIIEAISRTLESLNYKVTSYVNSIKAFKKFAEDPQKYDILVTDLTMPGMTGVALIKEIKNIKPEIKIVLCSGLGSNGYLAKDIFGDSVGVFMTKPVTRRGYGESLAKILGK